MDADVYGPSIPKMVNLKGPVHLNKRKILLLFVQYNTTFFIVVREVNVVLWYFIRHHNIMHARKLRHMRLKYQNQEKTWVLTSRPTDIIFECRMQAFVICFIYDQLLKFELLVI